VSTSNSPLSLHKQLSSNSTPNISQHIQITNITIQMHGLAATDSSVTPRWTTSYGRPDIDPSCEATNRPPQKWWQTPYYPRPRGNWWLVTSLTVPDTFVESQLPLRQRDHKASKPLNWSSQFTEDSRETTFLFQRMSVALQRGNVVSFLGTFPQD